MAGLGFLNATVNGGLPMYTNTALAAGTYIGTDTANLGTRHGADEMTLKEALFTGINRMTPLFKSVADQSNGLTYFDILKMYNENPITVFMYLVNEAVKSPSGLNALETVFPTVMTEDEKFVTKVVYGRSTILPTTPMEGMPVSLTTSETKTVQFKDVTKKGAVTASAYVLKDDKFGPGAIGTIINQLAQCIRQTNIFTGLTGIHGAGWNKLTEFDKERREYKVDEEAILEIQKKTFCAAASNQTLLKSIISDAGSRIPGADVLLIPAGASTYINGYYQGDLSQGEPLSVITIATNPKTGLQEPLEIASTKPGLKTLKIANGRALKVIEIPSIYLDKTIDPMDVFRDPVVMGLAFPFDLTASEASEHDPNNMIMEIPSMTEGKWIRVDYKYLLANSGLYKTRNEDPLGDYIEKLNKEKVHGDKYPYDTQDLDSDDEEQDPIRDDVELVTPSMKKDVHTDLSKVQGFRNNLIGLRYDSSSSKGNKWKRATYIGSFERQHVPGDMISRLSTNFINYFSKKTEIKRKDINKGLANLRELYYDMYNAKATREFFHKLIIHQIKLYGSADLAFENVKGWNNDNVKQWKTNKYGAMELYDYSDYGKSDNIVYPPGYQTPGGIEYLASLAGKNTKWSKVAERAKKVWDFVKKFVGGIKQHMPTSLALNPLSVQPWFKVKTAEHAFISTIFPPTPPVWLATKPSLILQEKKGKYKKKGF